MNVRLPALVLALLSTATGALAAPPELELLGPQGIRVTTRDRVKVVARVRHEGAWVDVARTGGRKPLRVERGALFVDEVDVPEGLSTIELTPTDAAGATGATARLTVNRMAALGPAEFKKDFVGDQTSAGRRGLMQRLDATSDVADERGETSRSLLLTFGVRTQPWFIREAAIDALAESAQGAISMELEELTRAPDAIVAEGALLALARSADPKRVPALVEGLSSPSWLVARAAAWGLAALPDVRAIEPLIAAWERPQRWLVVLAIREALQRLAGARGADAAAWRAWWTGARERFSLSDRAPAAPPEEAERIVIDGITFHVRLRGPIDGPALFFLPELGFEAAPFEPYLEPLSRERRLVLITLPVRGDMTMPADAGAIVPYPLARVAAAFEGLREVLVTRGELSDAKAAVIAHGLGGYVALRWASAHRERFRRLVLVGVPSSHERWLAGVERLSSAAIKHRDLELELAAPHVVTPSLVAATGDPDGAISRARWTSRFFDFRRLEIGRLIGPMVEKEVGDAGRVVPAGERPTDGLARPAEAANPGDGSNPPSPLGFGVLCVAGARDHLVTSEEATAMAEEQGEHGRLVTFPNGATFMVVEENDKFLELMERFIGRAR